MSHEKFDFYHYILTRFESHFYTKLMALEQNLYDFCAK